MWRCPACGIVNSKELVCSYCHAAAPPGATTDPPSEDWSLLQWYKFLKLVLAGVAIFGLGVLLMVHPDLRGNPKFFSFSDLLPGLGAALVGAILLCVAFLSIRRPKQIGSRPVIFEIPLDQPEKFNVIMVWDGWEGVRSKERTQVIQEAYKDKAEDLSLALGVTYKEAIEQGVLPFRVRLKGGPQPKFTEEEIRIACLSVVGFAGPEGSVELRFPTRATAEEAVELLKKRLTGSQWVVSSADS